MKILQILCDDSSFKKGELHKYLGKVDESKSYFRWNFKTSQIELTKIINGKTLITFDIIKAILPIQRGVSGRILKLKITGEFKSQSIELILETEYEIRRVFAS